MKPVHITYYVHGTTVDNEKGLASGWHDCPLSKLGREQSVQLGELIKSRKRDAVYCSDFRRAVESAKLMYGDAVPVFQDRRMSVCAMPIGSSSSRNNARLSSRSSADCAG